MISDSEDLNSQSLHYTVKAFLFSASLKVQILKENDLKRAKLSSSFKFPPPFGPLRTFEMIWDYSEENATIEVAWGGESRQSLVPRSIHKLDLAQLFWGGGATDMHEGVLLWRQEDVHFKDFSFRGRSFSFDLERKGKRLATVEGEMGSDGLLDTMKLTLSLPVNLGTIKVERKS